MMDAVALREYFDRVAGLPVRFGVFDCVVFVAESLRVGWSRDYLSSLAYSDRRSAVARLRRSDGLSLAVSDILGDPIELDHLVAGDIAFIPNPDTLGLVMPGYIAVKGNRTIHRATRDSAIYGWAT